MDVKFSILTKFPYKQNKGAPPAVDAGSAPFS